MIFTWTLLKFVISKLAHMGTTQEDEGSIGTMFFKNNISSNCNWLYEGRRRINLFCFHLKNITNEGFDLQSYKIQICTRYFEMFVTIRIIGSNINLLCKFFLQNKCMFNLCSLEWGGSLFHLHLQMVSKFKTINLLSLHKVLKIALASYKDAPT